MGSAKEEATDVSHLQHAEDYGSQAENFQICSNMGGVARAVQEDGSKPSPSDSELLAPAHLVSHIC